MTRVRVTLKVWEDGYNVPSRMQKTVRLDMSKEQWMTTNYDTQMNMLDDKLRQDDYLKCQNVRYQFGSGKTL